MTGSRKFKLIMRRKQSDKWVDEPREIEVECRIPPKVGPVWASLVYPLIIDYILEIKEIKS